MSSDRIRRAFDAAASTYDDHAVVQRVAARRLADAISGLRLPERPRILEIGCGTGLLSGALRQRLGPARWVLTDISPAMLAVCRKRLGAPEDTAFQVLDGERPDLAADERFDLICASLAFQWFEDLPAALRRLARHLAPGGTLAFATLAEDTLFEWREAHAALGLEAATPDFPALAALERMRPATVQGPTWNEWLVHAETDGRGFVQGLKAIGAGSSRPGRRPLGPAPIKRVLARFEAGGAAASYHVAYGLWGLGSGPGVFVTGTDTGVGKTVVSACLAKAWDADYWKPVQTGLDEEPGDTATVAALAELSAGRLHPPAHAFGPPVSPHLAAARAGVRLQADRLQLPQSDRPIVVEGAGGALVPLNERETMLDLMLRLRLPVVLVAADRLGAINQTLLTLEAVRARGLQILGVVLTGEPFADNRDAIERHGRVRILAELPRAPQLDPAQVARWAADMPALDSLLG